MFKRAFFLLALAALVLPAAAAAKVYEVSGARIGFIGRGDVKAELTASADAAKPVRIMQAGGTLEITPLSDNVKIQCKSRGAQKSETSTSCTGKAVLAFVTGSHFSIHASGKLYALGIPAGYTGKVDAAKAVQCGQGGVNCRELLKKLRKDRAGGDGRPGNGGNAAEGKGKDNGGGTTGTTGAEPGTDASLAELAAALAALGQ